ncbi:hypothetical protein HY994_04735 [Candidatus Micrarchaeota archaeon]|nr:hypothetical protein [Candidatus Micrarchaeota archaeon]
MNIPVKKETKDKIDAFRHALGARSYDETLNALAKRSNFLLIKDLKGILTGTEPFVRDKRDRVFG